MAIFNNVFPLHIKEDFYNPLATSMAILDTALAGIYELVQRGRPKWLMLDTRRAAPYNAVHLRYVTQSSSFLQWKEGDDPRNTYPSTECVCGRIVPGITTPGIMDQDCAGSHSTAIFTIVRLAPLSFLSRIPPATLKQAG